ncbi:MAG: hypothetical protein M3Y66_00880 [Actinomycetota bacterium]|nr:hypothetical protein [Actinomycetota bacterium]
MAIGERRSPEDELQDYARLQVRAGFLDAEQTKAEVVAAIQAELPGIDADVLARAWLARATAQLRTEAAGWPPQTDYDRLQAVFAECEDHQVGVLQGIEDHWAAKAELDRLAGVDQTPRGVAWFTSSDVWHAVDEGMLEVNLWHGSTANAAPGDLLLDAVLACFARNGLPAHFDDGRIEVSAHWQRRPGGQVTHEAWAE